MESGKYYVVGYGNNLYESMTKEEILAAITQAVSTHTIGNVDTGFVTTLKEINNNKGLKVWIGSTAEYNAIQNKETNCLYILTDDTILEDIETLVNDLTTQVNNLGVQYERIAEKSIKWIWDWNDIGNGWSWHVHVYASGFVEAWGAKTLTNVDVATAEGSMYVMADGGFTITYPTELTSGGGFVRNTISLGWDSAYYGLPFARFGQSETNYINIMRAITATGITGTISIYMTGTTSMVTGA